MLLLLLFPLNLIPFSISYNRLKAVQYAHKFALTPNHKCGDYLKCTPYAFFGGENCGYLSHGGDSANFVSQAINQAEHPPLGSIDRECRGYPCGKEITNVLKLDTCLINKFKWKRKCGYMLKPPESIKIGDVVVFYNKQCQGGDGVAAIVTRVNGKDVRVSGHSPAVKDVDYNYYCKGSKYISWIMFNE